MRLQTGVSIRIFSGIADRAAFWLWLFLIILPIKLGCGRSDSTFNRAEVNLTAVVDGSRMKTAILSTTKLDATVRRRRAQALVHSLLSYG
jgi:hypothetical protein